MSRDHYLNFDNPARSTDAADRFGPPGTGGCANMNIDTPMCDECGELPVLVVCTEVGLCADCASRNVDASWRDAERNAKQRDDLIVALREIADPYRAHTVDDDMAIARVALHRANAACAAIAKAKGEAT